MFQGQLMNRIFVTLCLLLLALAAPIAAPPARAAAATQAPNIDASRLIVRPRSATGEDIAPSMFSDPFGWVRVQQRIFYDRMAKYMTAMRAHHAAAAWMLMFMSFVYGILHAAGPGHGKAVVSAWLMANERQLRRGVVIACLGALVQATTAIIIVSAVLMLVERAGSTARAIAGSLQSASFALIALMGLYLLWSTLAPLRLATAAGSRLAPDHRHHDHAHHDHGHAHDDHVHDDKCGCGHAHMPDARALSGDFSLRQAITIALAVGIRPCSGALLVLLLASAVGLYWAGIAATFAMAIGTAITVSCIAVLAVTSRRLALRLAGRDAVWLARTATGLKLAAGIFITLLGGLFFWASLSLSAIT